MFRNKKFSAAIIIVLVIALVSAGCGQQSPQGESQDGKPAGGAEKKFLSIATGTMSGTYYSLGNSLASLYNEKIGGNINFSAEATSGSAQNVTFLGQGESDLALDNNDVAKIAYEGTGTFEGKKIPSLRGITSIYGNSVHIIVGKGSNIKTVSELKGKKVSVGAAGSGVESIARMVVDAYGMNYWDNKDFTPEYLGVTETMEKLKNGQLDAVFMTGLPPMGAIVDVFMGGNVELISIDEDIINRLIEKYPELYAIKIPKGSYNGQETEISTVANAALLLTSEEIDEETVYNMTKTLFENLDYLISKNNVWKQVTEEDIQKGMTVPLHPGAEKYFKEQGIIK